MRTRLFLLVRQDKRSVKRKVGIARLVGVVEVDAAGMETSPGALPDMAACGHFAQKSGDSRCAISTIKSLARAPHHL